MISPHSTLFSKYWIPKKQAQMKLQFRNAWQNKCEGMLVNIGDVQLHESPQPLHDTKSRLRSKQEKAKRKSADGFI